MRKQYVFVMLVYSSCLPCTGWGGVPPAAAAGYGVNANADEIQRPGLQHIWNHRGVVLGGWRLRGGSSVCPGRAYGRRLCIACVLSVGWAGGAAREGLAVCAHGGMLCGRGHAIVSLQL